MSDTSIIPLSCQSRMQKSIPFNKFSLYHKGESKIWLIESILPSLQKSAQFWRTSFQNGFCKFCLNRFAYPIPNLKSFWKSMPDNVYQDTFLLFCITLLSHVIFSDLINTFILTIRRPPADRSLIIIPLFTRSGPKFHKNLKNNISNLLISSPGVSK